MGFSIYLNYYYTYRKNEHEQNSYIFITLNRKGSINFLKKCFPRTRNHLLILFWGVASTCWYSLDFLVCISMYIVNEGNCSWQIYFIFNFPKKKLNLCFTYIALNCHKMLLIYRLSGINRVLVDIFEFFYVWHLREKFSYVKLISF